MWEASGFHGAAAGLVAEGTGSGTRDWFAWWVMGATHKISTDRVGRRERRRRRGNAGIGHRGLCTRRVAVGTAGT